MPTSRPTVATPPSRLRRAAGRVAALFSRLRNLPLRSKVSLLFGLIALVAGVSVAVVTYSFARSSLLDQRAADARASAYEHAEFVNDLLRNESGELLDFSDEVQRLPETGGFVQVLRDGNAFVAWPLESTDPAIVPASLRTLVGGGDAAAQRFRHDGEAYLGIGIPLPAVDVEYYEAFPLDGTERTLRNILLSFSIGATLAVGLFGLFGILTGRRLLRPLGDIADAATEIAAGELDTRVVAQRDPDLRSLVDAFNGMADAVQTRIERESRFVSDVSHELRSPITALQAATDVLERRRDEFADRTRQAVDVIIDQVRRFNGMVLDLLELSRIDAGASDLHLEPTEIEPICRRLAHRLDLDGLPIERDGDAPTHVLADRLRFERILGNLLQNAKVHADGPTRIIISAVDDDVEIAIEDAGPGVDEAERTAIFGRYTRGKESRHRVGTGLGLALVAEHAAALGGSARVEPRPDGLPGARFVVRLPAAGDDDIGVDE